MNPKLRDILLFLIGLGILLHQTIIADSPSAILVSSSIALIIGAPAVYRLLGIANPASRDSGKTS
jgi:hypothetical protein